MPEDNKKVTITVRVSKEIKEALLDIAEKEERTITYLCAKAIEEYIKKWKSWKKLVEGDRN